jgi:beta-lactamase regulating signal transducer with metallopeptidase domain
MATEEPAPPEPAFPWQALLIILWATGSVLWWALAGWRVYRFQILLRHAQPAPPDLQAHAGRLAARFGRTRCPGVWLVPGPLSPMLWALAGTPRLLLPADLWDRLSDEQRDTLLLHELAHWHRGDHWVRRLELLVLGLYWWHPVAWWARRQLQEVEEQCCDAWVVWGLPESAAAYADALVTTLAFLSRPQAALPIGASGMGRLHPVKRRLSMILRGTTPRALTWPAFVALLALVALLPLRPTWAVPGTPDEPAVEAATADPPAAQATEKLPPVSPSVGLPAQDRPPAPPAGLPPANAVWNSQVFRNEMAVRKQQVEQAEYEVKLAEVQLGLKQSELREAQVHVQGAQRNLERVSALNDNRAVSRGELDKMRDALQVAQAQVEQKEFGVREAELRLQQARRRLEGMSPGPERPATSTEQAFQELSHDFGRVKRGAVLEHAFVFRNRAPETAHIARVRVSNASVTAIPEDMEIAPGKTGRIRVRLDTSRFSGGGVAGIYVTFDRPLQEQVTLTVRAQVEGGAPTEPANLAAPGDRDGLKELERKLDTLLKEVESLRKELRQRKSSQGGTGRNGGDIMTTNSRTFKIPFEIDTGRRAEVTSVELWSSADQGQTWQLAAQAPPAARAFTYTAPAEGLYWFGVRTVDDQGRRSPDNMSRESAGLKVRVETATP